jgi:uncharacterized protein (DUF2141 family)
MSALQIIILFLCKKTICTRHFSRSSGLAYVQGGMNKMKAVNLAVIFTVLILLVFPLQANSGTLTVEISELYEINGQILIGLYHNAETFPNMGKAYKGVFLKVEEKAIKYTFSDIPNGTYAIAVIHDINNNSKLDKNLFGKPIEGYGFSNNATAAFGAPSFEEAEFHLDGPYTAQIKMKY